MGCSHRRRALLCRGQEGCLCAFQAASSKTGHGNLMVHFHSSKPCDFSMRCSGNDSAGTAKWADVLGTKSVSSGNREMVMV